jgi:hypothetical protein
MNAVELATQHAHGQVAIEHAGSQMKHGRRHGAQTTSGIDGPARKRLEAILRRGCSKGALECSFTPPPPSSLVPPPSYLSMNASARLRMTSVTCGCLSSSACLQTITRDKG